MNQTKFFFKTFLTFLIITCSLLTVTCGDSSSGDPTGPGPVKSVSVGAQSGTMVAGTGGQVSYPVTTENIADGSYTATVANRPSGVTVGGNVAISNNKGTCKC